MPPKKETDAQGYLKRRGWEPNPSNNVWRRVERKTPVKTVKDEKGNDAQVEEKVECVLEEALEQEALDLQQGRDIEHLLEANAKLGARVALLESLIESPAPVSAPAPAPAAASKPAPATPPWKQPGSKSSHVPAPAAPAVPAPAPAAKAEA